MNRFYTFAWCLVAAMAVQAQSLIISPTGMMDEIGMEAESMSPNALYVAGINQLTLEPAIWNVQTGDVTMFSYRDTAYSYEPIYGQKEGWEYIFDWNVSWLTPVDSVWGLITDYDVVLGYDTIWDIDDYAGSLHAINNAGLAVGDFGSGYGDKYPIVAYAGGTEVNYLYANRNFEAGGGAYAINADGSIILGFYFDGAWTVHACLWLNGGQNAEDRVDLPAPSEEAFGGPIDYVAARWMSADASVILGYAQDAYTGSWVAVYWTRNDDGSYTPHANLAYDYFTPYSYDLNGNGYYVRNEKPYTRVEPNAISADGQWISLTLMPKYDLMDWFARQQILAARYNIQTGQLEVLDLGEEDAPIFFGIANNGTAVGATMVAEYGPMAPGKKKAPLYAPLAAQEGDNSRMGYVWAGGMNSMYSLQEVFPDEPYFNYEPGLGEAAISDINAEGTKIVGFTNKTDGVTDWVVTSFIAELPQWLTAVENVETTTCPAQKLFEDGQIVILRDGARYTLTGVRLR